ncbi:MAG: hypothetical protein VYD57_04460 [Pseudomonadota bacterium]|nr:hypothetical protein [Pseudomonadota bacterium]
MRRVLTIGAWSIFTFVVLVTGFVLLFACGLSAGFFFDRCAAPAAATSADDMGIALRRERDALLAAANAAPQCSIQRLDDEASLEPNDQVVPACGGHANAETIVLLDVSPSMKFNFKADPALLAQFGASGFMDFAISEALKREPGVDRIDVARDALRSLARTVSSSAPLDLYSFSQCGRAPAHVARYDASNSESFDQAVANVQIGQETALAAALASVPNFTDRGRSASAPLNIVLLADGDDGCRGDPCETARSLMTELPFATLSFVAMAETPGSSCIGDAPNATFYRASDVEELGQRLRAAAGQLTQAECDALDGPVERDPENQ